MAGLPEDVHFSNRPFGVKRFQAIHYHGVDVARGLDAENVQALIGMAQVDTDCAFMTDDRIDSFVVGKAPHIPTCSRATNHPAFFCCVTFEPAPPSRDAMIAAAIRIPKQEAAVRYTIQVCIWV
jgi:hypothetical protein